VILDDVAAAAAEWRRRAAEAEAARRRLRSLMRDAAQAGHTQRQIARAAEVSLGRVGQILSGDQRRQAAAPDLSDPDPPTRA
jgi:hypothetical protein